MTWIKLYRRFTRWEWFDKPEMVQLFVWMLLEASCTDRAWHGQTIKRGQLLTTEPAISEATGLSRQQIRTCIGRLIETEEIIRETIGKSTDKKTLITICRYDDYQAACVDEQPTSNRQATDKQPTKQECKNNINIIISARAREEEGYINTLKSEVFWLDVMAKNFGSDRQGIISLLDQFAADCQCRGSVHDNLTDARQHFNNWMNKRREQQSVKRAAPVSRNVNEIWK